MSQLGVDGLRAERDAMLEVLRSLDADEWTAPSGDPGLSVHDLVAHVASTHHGVMDPAHLPGNGDPVAARRDWDGEQLVDEFDTYTAQTVDVFASMQRSSKALPMGQFGTHPASQLADLYLYDMYGHLRADILGPFGPVDRPEPPRDEQRLRPTVEWMVAAWPCMCPPNATTITLELAGTGGGTWTIGPGEPVATVHSDAHGFVLWGTGRRPFTDYVQIDGDAGAATAVLAEVRII